MSERNDQDLLALAVRAARAAGAALKAERAAWAEVVGEEGREVKVRADAEAERLILDILRAETAFPILSEEAGWVDDAARHRVWAVDPLDGSVNYARGYPHCAVSIALVEAGRPKLGVVYDFLADDVYAGVVGRGATLNGAPIRVSAADAKAKAILCTGIPARADTQSPIFRAFMDEITAWRKVRMIGSAAMALAYVAAGRAEAYQETGGMLWDVAGGCALVEAAGGLVTIEGAGLDQPLTVRATNGRV